MSFYCNLGFLFISGQNAFNYVQEVESVDDLMEFEGPQSIMKFAYLFMAATAFIDHLMLMTLGGCLLSDINARIGMVLLGGSLANSFISRSGYSFYINKRNCKLNPGRDIRTFLFFVCLCGMASVSYNCLLAVLFGSALALFTEPGKDLYI